MRVSRLAPYLWLLLMGVFCGLAVLASRPQDWSEPFVLGLLLVFGVAADRVTIKSRSGMPLVGSLPVFVLTAVLFGPAPATLLAIVVTLVQPRKQFVFVAADLGAYAAFPVIVGLVARFGQEQLAGTGEAWLLLLSVAVYLLAWTLNFVLIAGYMRVLRGDLIGPAFHEAFRPLLGAQLAHGAATAALVSGYLHLGAAAIVLAGLLVLTYSRLQRDLIEAERLRDDAQERNELLAAANERLRRAHFGAMRSLVRSIHLHDQMTARHSAAVARYARAMARAAGCTEAEQQLVHTAGLLHDVGKHILDDAILKGDSKLDDDQWELVKRHPEEGARIVRMLEGQEDVAAIIHAHHERIDGRGYPRGLAGEDIPRLSRMISIADTYDVMTARDSYRDPVSAAEAVAELRRVSGAQLDGELVEIFVREVLGHGDTAFGHNDDADFEAELALDRLAEEPADAAGDQAPVAA